MTYPLIALLGPSGAGKSTLVELLVQRFPERLRIVRTVTCRPWREPSDALFYRFCSRREMLGAQADGRYVRISEYVTKGVWYLYADERRHVEEVLRGHVGVKALDTSGVEQWREQGYRVIAVGLIPVGCPPTMDETRHLADKERARIQFEHDLLVLNRFALGGKEAALAALCDFLRDSVF